MEKMTYDEQFDAVQSFCDKYDSLIDEAPKGSDLYAFRELSDAFDEVDKVQTSIWKETITSLKTKLISVMLHIAEKWAYENQDIELVCTDPATGEEVVVEGTPSEEENG